MVKAINILLLFVFVNFISAPTLALVTDISLPTISFSTPEEETHSSNSNLNSFSEEEDLKFLSLFFTPFYNTDAVYKNEFLIETKLSINDDLVLKIPSPPPELI
nr:hypothetical protein [uncultured Flavobacterium sp.]